MVRPLTWNGIVGEAAKKLGGAKHLAEYTGLSYSTLRRFALDESKMPPIIRIGFQAILKEM